jgi:hypothetical protein
LADGIVYSAKSAAGVGGTDTAAGNLQAIQYFAGTAADHQIELFQSGHLHQAFIGKDDLLLLVYDSGNMGIGIQDGLQEIDVFTGIEIPEQLR